MMLGDPYKFSILIDVVSKWNIDDSYCNGVLLFCVDGEFFPKEVDTAVLKAEVKLLVNNFKHLTIDEELYAMTKDEAFKKLFDIRSPADTDSYNDYRFDITPLVFSDRDCYVFAVSNGKQVRIMASKLNYNRKDSIYELENINVSETFVDIGELNEIISELYRVYDMWNIV